MSLSIGIRLKINILGIDFTFSNQPITKPDSLHKIDPHKLNYY